MPRQMTTAEARATAAQRENPGRKPGVRMRCGECGQRLTASEWRKHPTECPKRPAA